MRRRRNNNQYAIKNKKYNENDNSGLLGFGIDAIKVIFKLKPDDDQTIGEFLMEKIGAIVLLLVVIGIGCAILLFLYFEATHGY